MSQKTLKLAAEIRDEQREAANTSKRVGQCLEEIITEFDDFTARFPASRIPAQVVDISTLDSMNTSEFTRLDEKGVGGYFLVAQVIGNRVPLNLGTLEIFSDDARHVVTQIFKTHLLLSPDGRFTAGHDHNHIYIYTRSYGLTMGSQHAGPAYFPLHGWGQWRLMTAIAPSEEDGGRGMAGLMSAEDRQLLLDLSRDVKSLKAMLEEFKKTTFVTE